MPNNTLSNIGIQTDKFDDLLLAVASENIDDIPDEFSDHARFVINSIRAAARRVDIEKMCAFVYSDAARQDTLGRGFVRIAHMQDGHGSLSGAVIATNRESNNGMCRLCSSSDPATMMDELEELALGERCTVFWDPLQRVATIYPNGVNSPDDHIRNVIPGNNEDLTQDEIKEALDTTYKENLCNPSGRTAKLWTEGKLVKTAEDELERHIKGQLTTFFAGKRRRIKILSQTNMTAGRADLIFLQRSAEYGPRMIGVLELKVLRGPEEKNAEVAKEGLSQGFFYRKDLELPFATLALFDVADPPSDQVTEILTNQLPEHLAHVQVKRYPLYNCPKAWRDAGGLVEAA